MAISSAEGAPKLSESTGGLGELRGRWKLDREASDSFEPVMKALEVSWWVRQIAGVGSVYLTLDPASSEDCGKCPVRVSVTEETPVRTTEFEIVLDGVERPGADPAGNTTHDRYTTPQASEVVLERRRILPSGRSMRLREHRSIGADSGIMESTLKVWIEDKLEVTSRRVFNRVE
ncbi:MAG: hypothetical protein GY946_16805 [bacterium]|nr:hypothetical protein [bacterium]